MSSEIDEASRRWPGWQGGQAIVLPDGQTWWFHAPAATNTGWTFGPDVSPNVNDTLSTRLHTILAKWRRATNDADRASSILEAAWFLLARNYNVTQDEFEAILAPMKDWDLASQQALCEALLLHVGIACAEHAVLAEGA